MTELVLLITAEDRECLWAVGLGDSPDRFDRFMGEVKELFKLAEHQSAQIQDPSSMTKAVSNSGHGFRLATRARRSQPPELRG